MVECMNFYRAKETQTGKWKTGALIAIKEKGLCYIKDVKDMETISPDKIYICDAKTLCACSGIRINDTLLFEDDIVRTINDGQIGIVKYGRYDDYHYGWYIEWQTELSKYYRKELLFWLKEDPVEIVGNIFDNPEMEQHPEKYSVTWVPVPHDFKDANPVSKEEIEELNSKIRKI